MQKYRRYDPVSAETFSERTALVKGDQKAIDKRQLFHDQQAKCVYCGHKYGYSELQVEHIVPKVQGGQDNIRNCQLACYSCNKVKGEMTDQEFRRKHVSYLPQKERTPAAPPIDPKLLRAQVTAPAPRDLAPRLPAPLSVGTVLVWVTVALIVSGVAGYAISFRLAQSACDTTLAAIGVVAAGIALVWLTALFLGLLWKWRPLEGKIRKPLSGLGIAIVAGGAVGYGIGVPTAQPVCETLDSGGLLAVTATIFVGALWLSCRILRILRILWNIVEQQDKH